MSNQKVRVNYFIDRGKYYFVLSNSNNKPHRVYFEAVTEEQMEVRLSCPTSSRFLWTDELQSHIPCTTIHG